MTRDQTPQLRTFAAFLCDHCLDEIVEEYLDLALSLDIPLLRLVPDMPREVMRANSKLSMGLLLTDIAEGRGLASLSLSLDRWQRDELPGVPREQIHASDLVMVYTAQKLSVQSFLTRFTQDAAQVLALSRELELLYMGIQTRAYQMFGEMHGDGRVDPEVFHFGAGSRVAP